MGEYTMAFSITLPKPFLSALKSSSSMFGVVQL